jgi:EmrB/QacA subfamily drug resistance transporter
MPAAASHSEAPVFTHREILVIFSGVLVGLFLAALDQSILATALPTIGSELGGLEHLSWIVSAYLLTSTASAPIYGKLSDLYGRRALLRAAIIGFIVASLLCGLARDMGQLIAFRALQGLGGGGLITMAQATIGDVVPPRERGRYQGYIAIVWALASVAGPVVGGLSVEYLSWRWVFWINLPIGAVALVLCHRVLRKLRVRSISRKIDYAGAALLTSAITALLLVATWGGSTFAWGSPAIIGLAVLGLVLLVVFVFQEFRAPEPILPPRLFRNPVFRVANTISFMAAMVMFGATLCLPVFLQLVTGASASDSGLLLVPMLGGMPIGATFSGRMMGRLRHYKVLPIFGLIACAAAYLLFATVTVATAAWVTACYMALLGFGLGLVAPMMMIIVQNAAMAEDLGAATSAVAFFRSMGGSFGAAALWAVLMAALGHELATGAAGAGLPPLGPDFLHAGSTALSALPPASRAMAAAALSRSFHIVFLVGAGLALATIVITFFLQEQPLRGGPAPQAKRRAMLGPQEGTAD